MKLIILAAGYATRLYPLTLNKPKPLLEVAGKPMIEHVLGSLGGVRRIDKVYVVTNSKFAGHFTRWAEGYSAGRAEGASISVIDDGTTDDSNKLGAVGDLNLVLTRESVADDLIVVAGDNLFDQSLEGFADYCAERDAPAVGVYDVGDLEEIRKYNNIGADFVGDQPVALVLGDNIFYGAGLGTALGRLPTPDGGHVFAYHVANPADYGVVEFDADGRVVGIEEKPAHPTGTVTAIALYYYPKSSLPLIRQYIAEGNNPDQPGRLVQWMYTRTPFYTWEVPGTWYDIGSKETLEEADRVFRTRAGEAVDAGG